MIFPGPFPFQNSAARRLAQWHPTANSAHLTQRCEDVAVGARMPEPFAKAPVALSHRTASWLPRCRLFPEKATKAATTELHIPTDLVWRSATNSNPGQNHT